VDVRRSKAIGILADPARALAMLQRHAALDDVDAPADDPAEFGDDPPDASPAPANNSADDRSAPPVSDASEDGPRADAADEATSTLGRDPDDEAPTPCPAATSPDRAGTHCGTCGATVGDPTVFVRPMRVDPARLRPAATLFVHTSREAWERARSGATGASGPAGAAGAGVARIEGVGPVTLDQAVEMLRHTNVTVREVIDLAEDRPVDGYEVPERMREILFQRSPGCVFPWSGGAPPRRGRDADHTVPYLAPDKGGPPGQTRIGNLGFLNRQPHRVKTHAPGWRHHQPDPGVHYWRTPTGYWFRVDHRGSHALGRRATQPWTDEAAESGAAEERASGTDLCWPLQGHSAAEAVLLDLLAG
jgi:hypothetical protein